MNFRNRYKIIPSFLLINLMAVASLSYFLAEFSWLKAAPGGIVQQIPYTASIVNSSGVSLADGNYRARVVIWDALAGGTQLFEETRNGVMNYGSGVCNQVTVDDGKLEILLGSCNTTLASILNNTTLFLELQLDMDGNGVYEEIFSPRRQLGSAASAINALRLVADGNGLSTNTFSLNSSGDIVATSLAGVANSAAISGADRLLLANSSGQFSQVSLSGSSIWGMIGNTTSDAWNGTTGARLGTSSAQPLVLATSNATAQDIRFFTGANGANERMRITGSGDIGIGTTSPSARFDLTATGTIQTAVLGRGNDPTFRLVARQDTTSNVDGSLVGELGLDNVTTRNAAIRFHRGTSTTGGFISFTTNNGAESLRLNSAGNLGLGMTTPGSRLTVQGSGGTGATSALNVTNSAATSSLFVRDDGLVGVGTTSPAERLSVAGTIRSNYEYNASVTFVNGWAAGDFQNVVQGTPGSSGASGLYEITIDATRNNLAESSTYLAAVSHSNSNVWRETGVVNDNSYISGSRCFTVDTNGGGNAAKFRIRALRASASCGDTRNLVVNFKIRSIGRNISWTALSGGGTAATVTGFQAMTGMSWNLYTGNPFSGAGNLALSANSAGNIGVGTTSPSTRLDVNGNIISNRIQLRDEPGTIGGSSANRANAVIQIGDDVGPFMLFDTNEVQAFNVGMSIRGESGIVFSTGDVADSNNIDALSILKNGNIGIRIHPTARLHLAAGTATANTAPLKFTSGVNLTAPEAGAMEWNGTNLFLTTSTNLRQTINQGLTATASLDFPSTNNDSFSNLTVAVAGAEVGDVVSLGVPNASLPAAASNFSAWVSATNTVTVRFSNHSGLAQDPASGSFRVFVTKF